MDLTDSELKDFRSLIEPFKEQLKIGIWYSPIGVLELVKQMSLEEHCDKCQREIRLASEITDKNILDHPWDHVKRIAQGYLRKKYREPDDAFLNLCREIAILPYSKMKEKIDRLRKAVKWEKNWARDLILVAKDMRKNFGLDPRSRTRRVQTDEFRSIRGILWRRIKNWRYFCRHFRLPSEFEDVPFDDAIRHFPSFLYWVDYRITYENKLIYDNKKPRPSDYFDWEQLVYLNIMDYLVTNDRGLRKILEESTNPELGKVTLGFDEFVRCLKGGLPPRRAPDSADRVWKDTRI